MGRPVHVEVSLDEVRGNQTKLIKKLADNKAAVLTII